MMALNVIGKIICFGLLGFIGMVGLIGIVWMAALIIALVTKIFMRVTK